MHVAARPSLRCAFAALFVATLLSAQVAVAGEAAQQPAPSADSAPTDEPVAKAAEERLTSAELDSLILSALGGTQTAEIVSDERFLRRVSLDLIGRQPTPADLDAFLADASSNKRANIIDALLATEEFGRNWANYWSDTIAFRVPQPELTFLNYTLLEQWFAEKLNSGATWDAIARDLLTGTGKVAENPAATFVGFHEASPTRLAGETSRIFLGIQIGCAECHDHPFDDWKREQFHELAAFFGRASAKLPWNDSSKIEVKDAGKGEYHMPDMADPRKKGEPMKPVFFATGGSMDVGTSDADRRSALAGWITSRDNAWFARAFVNRVWGRLMARGFVEPVDDLTGHLADSVMPDVHRALAESFAAGGYDVKALFRLVLNTQTYQRGELLAAPSDEIAFAASVPQKLSGDQVFDSLVTAIELPNVTPPAVAATNEVRFPPPPKSTRDLVNDAFGSDPSICKDEVCRTLSQAMLMMNNQQLQAQVNAAPDSGTLLAKVLAAESDDRLAFTNLFRRVMARAPTDTEVQIALDHIGKAESRNVAFEDLLWGLLNSAEFTTRR